MSTAPNVVYDVTTDDGTELVVTNPSDWPVGKVAEVREPITKITILVPSEFIGTVMELCQSRRGQLGGMDPARSSKIARSRPRLVTGAASVESAATTRCDSPATGWRTAATVPGKMRSASETIRSTASSAEGSGVTASSSKRRSSAAMAGGSASP